MLENPQESNGLLSLTNLISLIAIIIATILLVMSCLITVSVPCVSNFYNEMPLYLGAELIGQKSSALNYLGAGELELTYWTVDNIVAVEAWYRDTVDEARVAVYRAQVSGGEIPAVWNHIYRISAGNDGTEIQLEADCLN